MNAQHPKRAEEYFIKALRLEAGLSSSRYQLARVLADQGEYARALVQIDKTMRLEPRNSSVHYLRGQILQHLGRKDEARAEMREASQISNVARSTRQQELENPVANPELMQPKP
jgi:tetratricopeptide (TPR) repeat protein